MQPPRYSRVSLLLVCLLVFLATSACGSGGGVPADTNQPQVPIEFQFNTTEQTIFRIEVTMDGLPSTFSSVRVADALPPPTNLAGEAQRTNVYFQGVTDGAGRCTALLKLPTALECVDIIVQRPNAVGPYTLPSYRKMWGPFAPSARVTTPIELVGSVAIDLVKE